MSFDTKYRPTHYADVLGQDATTAILREFVKREKGFHQSYLFCGQHGSGKTTLGRILARALLCETPKEGEACDTCASCQDILGKGVSECFAEFDAATNSGKEDITRLTDELEYHTFAGKQHVYLIDEAHRLSKNALDALLKPMEDEQVGSSNKKMVCIFCTTEPEKMATTVFSRCAPAFTIRVVSPEVIATRLALLCDQEGIQYEEAALVTIAAVKECHIRDALKAIEAIDTLGPITMDNVRRALLLDANESLARLLAYLGSDLPAALREADALVQIMSPTTIYERLAEIAMLAFKVALGAAKSPAYWKAGFIEKLGEHHGDFLIGFAQCFASRPRKPSPSMLALDLARLHQVRSGALPPSVPVTNLPVVPHSAPQVPPSGTPPAVAGTSDPLAGKVVPVALPDGLTAMTAARLGMAYETPTGRYIDPRGVKQRREAGVRKRDDAEEPIDPDEFSRGLTRRVRELRADGRKRGQERRGELGGGGTHPAGGATG